MVRRLTYFGSAGCVLLLAATLAAAPARIEEVQLGLGGRYKLGHWTPVRVKLTADEPITGDLQIAVPDGDDLWSRYSGGDLAGVALSAGKSQTVESFVRVGRSSGSLKVRFTAGGAEGESQRSFRLSNFQPAVDTQSRWVIVVGDSIGLDAAMPYLVRGDDQALVASLLDDPQQLPSRWYGYDGVSLLVLTSSRPEFYEQLSTAQRDAIVQWVQLGGKAMLTVGAQGQQVLQPGSLFAQLAPGDWRQTAPLRETTALESLAESSIRLDQPIDGEPAPPVLVTELRNPRGQVLLSAANNRPLVVQSVLGFGQVWLVAFDLDTPPIAGWKESGRLAARLLDYALREGQPPEDSHIGSDAAHLGFSDLTGQLRASLDQFAGVAVVPFSLIAALIVVYILLIGPGDYFLLKRLGRMEWTWVTFALLVIIFGGAAWWLAAATRSGQTLVNRVDIVDIDAETSLVRGTTWLRLYSPTSRSVDLSLTASPENDWLRGRTGMLFCWQGLPGKALGGMDAPSRLTSGGPGYEVRNSAPADEPPHLEIERLPIGHSTTKGFLARWWSTADLANETELHYREDGAVAGRLTNPLPVRLSGCVLYHDRRAYQLGTLEPWQEYDIDSSSPEYKNIRWLLTERRFEDGQDISTAWDDAMRDDVPKLIRMMMFHETAGGRAHTGLFHRYQGFIDQTSHLAPERAILVGRAEATATELTADGVPLSSPDDKHWTFYRIVLPVVAAK